MFTGIVKGVGVIADVVTVQRRKYLVLQPLAILRRIDLGGSVAFNGTCLTLAKKTKTGLWFEVMPETFRKTNLGNLKKGSVVNIEPALRFGDELGGHLVQGHVDGVGKITKVTPDKANVLVSVALPKELSKQVVLHGSITLDGISLTVARLDKNIVTVSLIAETLARTTWRKVAVGQAVNIELDVIAKYVKNFLR